LPSTGSFREGSAPAEGADSKIEEDGNSWSLPGLVEINLAGGAILFVLLVRRGMARFLAAVAYALGHRAGSHGGDAAARAHAVRAGDGFRWRDAAAVAVSDDGALSRGCLRYCLWVGGAIALAVLFARQAAGSCATPISAGAAIGLRNPRIVTPDDFSHRFSDERKLIITQAGSP
jgi:hypothetical protein